MAIEVSDYPDVGERAEALGCNIPTGLALLPRGFDIASSLDELLHESSVPTVRSLWRQSGIQETKLEAEGQHFPYIEEKSGEWIGPTIFLASALYTQNPGIIAVALNIISNYLTEHLFKGYPGAPKAKLDIVLENAKGKGAKRIHYEGDPQGLSEVAHIIEEMSKL